MSEQGTDNLSLSQDTASVDAVNAEFYGRFPYPWPPMRFVSLSDPDFGRRLLCQDLGDFEHRRLPRAPRIWIGGCGTNQAVLTALRFPESEIVGSDISKPSLEICAHSARQLGVSNLELREESLNHVNYDSEFDYVISTGVIHHNADPSAVLRRLSAGLKPGGVLELMVYNRLTWGIPAILQKAIRILGGVGGASDMETNLEIAQKLVVNYPTESAISRYIKQFKSAPESKLADALLQPLLHSYTVESLGVMAAECGLEFLAPCVTSFDKRRTRLSWNLRFGDADLQQRYDTLPDETRWQVSNLLEYDASHEFLWFYMQRKQFDQRRRSEAETVEAFLEARFTRSVVLQRSYVRDRSGSYHLSEQATPYPFGQPPAEWRSIVKAADGRTQMRELFARAGMATDFDTANEIRLRLTTSAYPFLITNARGGR